MAAQGAFFAFKMLKISWDIKGLNDSGWLAISPFRTEVIFENGIASGRNTVKNVKLARHHIHIGRISAGVMDVVNASVLWLAVPGIVLVRQHQLIAVVIPLFKNIWAVAIGLFTKRFDVVEGLWR